MKYYDWMARQSVIKYYAQRITKRYNYRCAAYHAALNIFFLETTKPYKITTVRHKTASIEIG